MKTSGFKVISFFIIFLFVIQSCKCRRDHPQTNISPKKEVEFKLSVQRFEKDLFAINIDSVSKYVPQLKAKYGEFFELFNYKVVKLGSSDDSKYPNLLKRFLTDYYMSQDYNRVMKVYPSIDDLTQKLTAAFARYKEYFPDKHIPRVYTFISGWNQSVVTADTILAIGLDKYLGRKCDFYEKLRLSGIEGFAKYLCYSMQREYIVSDCIRAWGNTAFEFNDSTDNVLNNMIYEGEMVYFVKQMLPEAHDTLILGFTPDQLKWCNNNAEQMWTYLVEHKLLFSTDFLTIHKLVYPAPFTSLFTQESPGRAVVWLGYRIVEAYMKNNKNVTLPQLMKNRDYQKILRMSKFKP